jgi:uncharacterized protein
MLLSHGYRRFLLMKIASLYRYPIKSMLGEEIDEAVITECGIVGDRGYALIDLETGHVASAKHPRKWKMLLQCRARYLDEPQAGAPLPPVEIILPDGRAVRSNQRDVDAVLSELIGRRVMLSCQPPETPTREANRADADVVWTSEAIRQEPMGGGAPSGTFFDFAPIHIITTATLARLREITPDSVFDARRFRPNVLVEIEEQKRFSTERTEHAEHTENTEEKRGGFVENGWLGRTLEIGGVRLYSTDPTPRCVVTTLAHGGLAPDLGVLKTVARSNAAASVTIAPGHVFQGVAGVYARSIGDGTIRVGDALSII